MIIPDTKPDDLFGYLTDAAPFERVGLDLILTEIVKRTGDPALGEEVETHALAYAREVGDRAYALGLSLGKEYGRLEERTAHDRRGPQAD